MRASDEVVRGPLQISARDGSSALTSLWNRSGSYNGRAALTAALVAVAMALRISGSCRSAAQASTARSLPLVPRVSPRAHDTSRPLCRMYWNAGARLQRVSAGPTPGPHHWMDTAGWLIGQSSPVSLARHFSMSASRSLDSTAAS